MIEKQTSLDRNSIQNGPERNSSNAIAPASASLPDSVLEKLYRSYALKQKRSALVTFLIASLLFDLWAIFIPQGQSVENLGESILQLVAIKISCRESLIDDFLNK
jgi:hypothetical protein